MVEKDVHLLSTKLFVPTPRPSLVSRPHLFDLLDESMGYALTLICAPAGYGKTTLLAKWITHCGLRISDCGLNRGDNQQSEISNQQFCWVSLDEEDNDPFRFLSYWIAGLERIHPGIGTEARALLGSYPPPPLQAILTVLINELNQLSSGICMVLDDYQFIANPAIHEGITFFLDHLPSNVHLVIATRSDPPFPFARLRARSQLLELRVGDLRFTRQETAAFLNQVMDLSLSSDDISALEIRTEGWIAGLQMAALSMRGRADIRQFIETFSGSHRYVLDFLAEEALNRQPKPIVDFLLKTSILDRLCGPLCDAVTENGEQRTENRDNRRLGTRQLRRTALGQRSPEHPGTQVPKDLPDGSPISGLGSRPSVLGSRPPSSQAVLEYLDHANLFLVSLDDERCWYRYHHLFADLLQAQLKQTEPDLVPTLHRRAAEWFDRNGFPAEAIQHALASRDEEYAANLIERHGSLRWSQGDPTLIMLAQRLSPQILDRHPKLGIYYAWMLIAQGQSPAILGGLEHVKERVLADPSNPDAVWMCAFIDILSAYRIMQTGDQAQTTLPPYQALELIPQEDPGLRNTADYLYAILLNRQGEFEQAADILSSSIQRDMAAYGSISIYLVVALLARLRILQGRLPEAAALCQKYLKPLPVEEKRVHYAAGSLNIILGEVLYEWNDLKEAEVQIRAGIQDNESWKNIVMDAIGYSDLVYIQLARGNLKGAQETMQRLEDMLQGHELILDLQEELKTYTVRLWIASGDLARAAEWADQLAATEPKGFLMEWDRISLARVRLAQSRFDEAQHILETLAGLPGSASRVHRQVRVDLLLAIAFWKQNQIPQALKALNASLSLAEPGGYTRAFLDSGETVRDLMAAYLRTPAPGHPHYAQRLLVAFTTPGSTEASGSQQAGLVEKLTERELDVLQLLGRGYTNRRVAEELFLSEGTVKFHVHSILGKMQVHSRTEALVKAKSLNLI